MGAQSFILVRDGHEAVAEAPLPAWNVRRHQCALAHVAAAPAEHPAHEQPVFVTRDGRPRGVARWLGRGVAALMACWLLAVGLGAAGFQRMPDLPPQGARATPSQQLADALLAQPQLQPAIHPRPHAAVRK